MLGVKRKGSGAGVRKEEKKENNELKLSGDGLARLTRC